MSQKPPIDYLDADVAYLLGLITARGTFYLQGDVRRLLIDFPHKLLKANPPPGLGLDFDVQKETRLALDDVRRRVNELLEVNVEINRMRHNVQLVAVFTKNTMAWRNLRALFRNRSSYKKFAIPSVIFEAPHTWQKEFVRGYADAAATPSHADRDWTEIQRIVLQVQHENWYLPIQLCKLLQVDLGTGVENILYGHPNLRGAKNWAKEHRIRIYAENFKPIGFYFSYKQQILEAMIEWNRKRSSATHLGCNPFTKTPGKPKAKRKDERHPTLPTCLRGRHFNAYFQICQALGCTQGTPPATS